MKIKSYCKACKSAETSCLVPGSHRAQGKWAYVVDFLLGGKPPKGTRIRKMMEVGITKEEAKKWAYSQITDFERGLIVPTEKGKTKFSFINDKYYNDHLFKYGHSDKSTMEYYKRTINGLLGHFHVGEITLQILQKVREKYIEETGALNSSVNRLFSIVKTELNRAVEWEYIQASPAQFLRNLPTEDTVPRFLSTEELSRLWVQFRKDWRVLDYATALAHTGIRPINIRKTDFAQVDLENKIMSYVTYKGRKPRTCTIPIDDTLMTIIQRRFKETGGRGRVFDTRFRHQLIEDMIEASGVNEGRDRRERFTLYGLKHCYISHLLMAGEKIETVSELVGVQVSTLMKHYVHLTQAHLRKAQERINLTPAQPQKLEVI